MKIFRQAVEWQGKPKEGVVNSLSVDQLLFKAYGEKEIEGRLRVLYKAPDSIYFNEGR